MIKNKLIGATMVTAGTALAVANIKYSFDEGYARGLIIQKAHTPKDKAKAWAWYGVSLTRSYASGAICGALIKSGAALMKM